MPKAALVAPAAVECNHIILLAFVSSYVEIYDAGLMY
jgi:hypothetical protein